MRKEQVYGFTVYDDGRVINTRTGNPCIVSSSGHIKASYKGKSVVKIKERLIYDTFAPEGEKLTPSDTVFFKDGDRTNYAFENLVCVHKKDLPVYERQRVLTVEQVAEVEKALLTGESIDSVAQRYGCCYGIIRSVKRGEYRGCQKQS